MDGAHRDRGLGGERAAASRRPYKSSAPMTIRDISQPLNTALPVWPGDTPFSATRVWDHDDGPVMVSRFTLSTHGGAHADAPLHYDPTGAAIDTVDLDAYIGPARVIDARGLGLVITAAQLASHLEGAPQRILLRTYERFPNDAWSNKFVTVAPDVIALLAGRGVKLIGLDSPSLDPQDSKTMEAHLAVRDAGLRILEGLVLDDVPAGDYELIALPLRLAGMDASPVRAVLRDMP
jgi:arylformamidase